VLFAALFAVGGLLLQRPMLAAGWAAAGLVGLAVLAPQQAGTVPDDSA
jgi:hypothetical protein